MENIELWRERVEAWRASGLTSTAYCVGRGFSAGGLRHWAHRLKKLDKKGPRKERPVRLVRVERVASEARVLSATEQPGRGTSPAAPDGQALVLEHEGTHITLWPGYDPATLASVLDVLSQRSAQARRAS